MIWNWHFERDAGSPSDLSSLFPPGKRRSKLKVADHALFGAMWWPYATPERLCIATYLSIWVSPIRRGLVTII